MGFKDWALKKLEEWREQRHLDQEERERIKEENKKHRLEIQDLLDKFTIKQLQNFCTSYIGALPEDEIHDEDVLRRVAMKLKALIHVEEKL